MISPTELKKDKQLEEIEEELKKEKEKIIKLDDWLEGKDGSFPGFYGKEKERKSVYTYVLELESDKESVIESLTNKSNGVSDNLEACTNIKGEKGDIERINSPQPKLGEVLQGIPCVSLSSDKKGLRVQKSCCGGRLYDKVYNLDSVTPEQLGLVGIHLDRMCQKFPNQRKDISYTVDKEVEMPQQVKEDLDLFKDTLKCLREWEEDNAMSMVLANLDDPDKLKKYNVIDLDVKEIKRFKKGKVKGKGKGKSMLDEILKNRDKFTLEPFPG